MSAGLV